MANYATDEDLLKMGGADFFLRIENRAGELSSGTDGVISGTSNVVVFTSATGDFINAGITSGHVIQLTKDSPAYDHALAVHSVLTSTSLLLEAKPAACPTATAVTYTLTTYDGQHEMAHFEMGQIYHIDDDDLKTTNDEADLYNRRQLRQAATYWVMKNTYAVQSRTEDDLYWRLTERADADYLGALSRMKLQFDADGDSDPERTVRGGSITLYPNGTGDAYPTTSFPATAEDV